MSQKGRGMAKRKREEGWRSRIVEHGDAAPDELLANPMNWRLHPDQQQQAVSALLDRVGWVQDVIVNRRTGHIVDGHLRVALAIARGEARIPVVYVDLDPEEEALILATLDPMSAMAEQNDENLRQLIGSIGETDGALGALLRDLAPEIPPEPAALETPAERARASDRIDVVCPDCGAEFSLTREELARLRSKAESS